MDKLIAVFESLPEKHFRTVVVALLVILLGLAGKTQLDLAVLKTTNKFLHGAENYKP